MTAPAMMDLGVELTVNRLVEQSHELSKSKGWYEGALWPDGSTIKSRVPIVEKLALIHSEISEALEEFRNHGVLRRCSHCGGGGKCDDLGCAHLKDGGCPFCSGNGFLAMYNKDGRSLWPDDKPEGFVIELADAVIRIADLCGALGLDLAEAIRIKHAYNATRPYRHGGKQC